MDASYPSDDIRTDEIIIDALILVVINQDYDIRSLKKQLRQQDLDNYYA